MLHTSNNDNIVTQHFHEQEFTYFQAKNGDLYFDAVQACQILKLSTKSHATRWLSDNLAPRHIRVIKRGFAVGRPGTYVDEPGFYRMINKSNTDEAVDAQNWFYDEVLPAIRRHGVYIDESRFNENEVNELQSIIRKRDYRIARLTNCTETLIDDIERVFSDHAKFLILGHIGLMNGERITKTFSQVRKDLVNMGFEQYTTDRFKLAIEIYLNRAGHIYPRTINMSDKTYLVEQNIDEFMESLYQSMRYDGDVSDQDTSINMYRFQKLFGVKYGEHRKQDRDKNAIEHIADIKEELIG
jgi:prophage antirepressor-like protein